MGPDACGGAGWRRRHSRGRAVEEEPLGRDTDWACPRQRNADDGSDAGGQPGHDDADDCADARPGARQPLGSRDQRKEPAVVRGGARPAAAVGGLRDSHPSRGLCAAGAQVHLYADANGRPRLHDAGGAPHRLVRRYRDARQPAQHQTRGRGVLQAPPRGCGRGATRHGGAEGAAHHEVAPQGEERHASAAQAGTPPDYRQGARIRRRPPLQPHPPAPHVVDARGPGAAPAGEGDRPHPLQARRARQAVRAPDPGRDRASPHRRGLLRPRRGKGDHLEPRQGGWPRVDDHDHAAEHRQPRRVRSQHYGQGLCSSGLCTRHSFAPPVPQGRLSVEEEVGGAAHWHQDRPADRHPHGLRHSAASQRPGRHHPPRPQGRAAEGPHHHCAGPRRAGRGCCALRHRVVRQRPQAALVRHQEAQGQDAGRLPQGDWLHHPADGRRVRQLLHQGADVHSEERVCQPRRGDEEDRPQGGEAVRWHRGRGALLRAPGAPSRVLQAVLDQAHGTRQQELRTARRDHGGARRQGGRRRDHRPHRRRPHGRL
mmetsp:Transcript_18164/g.70224  ORF Transcript_18164/g.70224 Transcript_18164/m.70224 type:complete len:540 (-) Transcript_18164:1365-2984(-)